MSDVAGKLFEKTSAVPGFLYASTGRLQTSQDGDTHIRRHIAKQQKKKPSFNPQQSRFKTIDDQD